MSETPASLIIAASESDSNLAYACRFLAPDPFVFLQVNGRKTLLMSDLEVDRARAQARVDEVLSLSEWEGKARQRWEALREAARETGGLFLADGDIVQCKKSEFKVKLLKLAERSFFDVLRTKLKWGERA